MQAMRVLQMGMQYLLYQRTQLLSQVFTREAEIEQVKNHVGKVQRMIKVLK
jgi:hypothetical protein